MANKMENKQSVTCPVCGGLLREQLPSMEGVLENLFWNTKHIRIVSFETVIECDFDHERDEEDENFPLEVPHPLVAEIKVVLDKGECTVFDILEVRLGVESSSDKNEGLYFLGAYGTPEVLEYIKIHPQCRKENLDKMVRDTTVMDSVGKLQDHDLIQDQELENGEKWYSLTEKGQQIVEIMRDLVKLVSRCSNG